MPFPRTISDLETIANLRVLNKTVLFAVCPSPKCSFLYQMNDISSERNGVFKPALCRNKLYGKRCNAELSFERKLSFEKTKMVPYRTYPFLAPSEWIKTFFNLEKFLNLIRNRAEPSTSDYRDIWDGLVLQEFVMDPDDNTKPILKDKMNLALLLYLDSLGVTNSRGSWVVRTKSWVLGTRSWVLGVKSWVVGTRSWAVGAK